MSASTANTANAQPTPQVLGGYPGMPATLPAGQPPAWNHGIWKLEADGSYTQITRSYKGGFLQTGNVCTQCGINRWQEWRYVNNQPYCSPCGADAKKGKARVPPPDHHILRRAGLRTGARYRRAPNAAAVAGAPTNPPTQATAMPTIAQAAPQPQAALQAQATFQAPMALQVSVALQAPAVFQAPMAFQAPVAPQAPVAFWQGPVNPYYTQPISAPQQPAITAPPSQSHLQPYGPIDPRLLHASSSSSSTPITAQPQQPPFTPPFGGSNPPDPANDATKPAKIGCYAKLPWGYLNNLRPPLPAQRRPGTSTGQHQ